MGATRRTPTGPPGTTPTPGWTARSRRHATPVSRCWVSILRTESQESPSFPFVPRATTLVACTDGGAGGEAGARSVLEVRCAMASKKSGGEQPLAEVKFLTVAEVATAMRVSKMTVYRLVHSGELPAVRVGRSFRVSEEDVNEDPPKSFFPTGRRPRPLGPARWSPVIPVSGQGRTSPTRSTAPLPIRPQGPVRILLCLPRGRCGSAVASTASLEKGTRGFCHQEAPQAHGEEEAPQAAEEDARPASSSRQVVPTRGERQWAVSSSSPESLATSDAGSPGS